MKGEVISFLRKSDYIKDKIYTISQKPIRLQSMSHILSTNSSTNTTETMQNSAQVSVTKAKAAIEVEANSTPPDLSQ